MTAVVTAITLIPNLSLTEKMPGTHFPSLYLYSKAVRTFTVSRMISNTHPSNTEAELNLMAAANKQAAGIYMKCCVDVLQECLLISV